VSGRASGKAPKRPAGIPTAKWAGYSQSYKKRLAGYEKSHPGAFKAAGRGAAAKAAQAGARRAAAGHKPVAGKSESQVRRERRERKLLDFVDEQTRRVRGADFEDVRDIVLAYVREHGTAAFNRVKAMRDHMARERRSNWRRKGPGSVSFDIEAMMDDYGLDEGSIIMLFYN